MRFLTGLIGVIIGLLIVKYREPIFRFTGRFDFAEKYLGSGGTLNFFLLSGSFLVILSIIYGFGFLENLINKTFSTFF